MPDVLYAIIGGGVVGCAVAHALSSRTRDIAVIERCRRNLLENQSTRNAGVIHAGIHYRAAQRPFKARFCVEGNAALYEFCAAHGVPHQRCGKLVVATDAREEQFLEQLHQIAVGNGVPGVRMIDGEESRAFEPDVVATRALYVPSSGVIDSIAYLHALRAAAGVNEIFGTTVTNIRPVGDGFELSTISPNGPSTFVARFVINAAGLYADEIAKLLDPAAPYTIMPVRGEAARFTKNRRPGVRMTGINVYPVTQGFYRDGSPALVGLAEFDELLARHEITDTLGVHLTPTLDEAGGIASTVTISPCIRTNTGKEDYGSNLRQPAEYLARVQAFFPGLRVEDIELHQTGIQARMPDRLDWVIERDRNHAAFIHLIGIDSPGMTASLAIARYVVDELL